MTDSTFQSLAHAVEAYYEELRQFVRKRTGSACIAEDVVQETWIRANTTAAKLPDNPRAYLYRMASNLAINQMRRERTRDRFVDRGGTDSDHETELIVNMPCPAPGPVDRVISQQELAALNAAVFELPEKCREVFLLYRGQALTMRQVAVRLCISEKTVEKHIARAMVHCRLRLREAGRAV